ncbi:hypothetical protein ACJX0J_034053, partial [Zea mays]
MANTDRKKRREEEGAAKLTFYAFSSIYIIKHVFIIYKSALALIFTIIHIYRDRLILDYPIKNGTPKNPFDI